jgi:O-antigen ligase
MILFYFLIGIMPLTDHRIWSQFVGELTMFKYVGAACVLYAIVRLATRRAIPSYFRTWQARLLVVLYLIATASYLTKSLPMPFERSPLMSYTSFTLLFFVTVTVVDSLTRLRWALLVAVGAVAFASLYVIREWQKYHNMFAGFRPGWVVGDPNYFAVSALLTLPIAFYLMLGARVPWERLFCAGCLLVTLLGITLGASRGGFLGLVVAFLLTVWHSQARLRNLALVSALILPLSLLSPISPLQRLLHPTSIETDAAETRTTVWRAGLHMMAAHPFIGVGLGSFKPMVPQYSRDDNPPDLIAHNAYVEIAAEMGLPALFAFLGILFFSYRTLNDARVHALRARLPFVWQAALGLQAGLVGAAVAIFFVSAQYQKLLWVVIFLSMCLPELVRSSAGARSHLEKPSVATAGNCA